MLGKKAIHRIMRYIVERERSGQYYLDNGAGIMATISSSAAFGNAAGAMEALLIADVDLGSIDQARYEIENELDKEGA